MSNTLEGDRAAVTHGDLQAKNTLLDKTSAKEDSNRMFKLVLTD